MATIAQVRALLGDMPRWDRQVATGDGVTKKFIVSALPIIAGSEAVTVNSTAVTNPANYTVDYDLGLFTFVTAPGAGQEIVVQFSYAELSDATITGLLALRDNAYFAAVMGARALAGKYASLVDKDVGDLSIKWSQRSKAWADLAKGLQAGAPVGALGGLIAPYAGGISRSDKQLDETNTDRVKPAFTRTLHDPDGDWPDDARI